MGKRIVATVMAAVYLLSAAGLAVAYLVMGGRFPADTGMFWAYTVLPAAALLVYLGAGALLLANRDRAAGPVVAAEVMFLAVAVVGSMLFFVTCRWLLLAAAVRAGFALVAILYVWGRLDRDRWQSAAGAAVGVAIGIVWPLTAEAPAEAAQPLVAGPRFVAPVWVKAANTKPESPAKVTVPLANGGRVTIDAGQGIVDLVEGTTTVRTLPLARFAQVSLDGAWTSPLNAMGMALTVGSEMWQWEQDGRKIVHCRYDRAERVARRLARSEAFSRLGDSTIGGDLYVSVDPATGAVDIVALVGLRKDIAVRETMLFGVGLQPWTDERVAVQVGGQAVVWDPTQEPVAMVNWLNGQVTLYEGGGESAGLTPRAAGETFGNYVAVEGLGRGTALLIGCPDWSGQALQTVSPSSGLPFGANQLMMRQGMTRAMVGGGEMVSVKQLSISAGVADTTMGRAPAVVRMAKGTYVNRMALRLVAEKSDYAAAAAGIKYWEPPPTR